ncbi:MAG: BrnT family toxin [Alphaproteobacteria bacterium]|nr:BrnT family toxin [Alphaproteobacteria bacterium]
MAGDQDVEFDAEKSERNRRLRGFSFRHAARVFESDHVEWLDDRLDYGEQRYIVLGRIEGRHHIVVYVWRGGRRRIISARRANAREIKRYERETKSD